MSERRLDPQLKSRLEAQLEAVQPPRPDPKQARYSALGALAKREGGGWALRGIGLGFVAGAATVCGAVILLTGSMQPQVRLDRAQGGVRRLEDNLVESRKPAVTPPSDPISIPKPTGPAPGYIDWSWSRHGGCGGIRCRSGSFPPQHPRARLLRHKRLIFWKDFGLQPWLGSARAAAQVAGVWRDGKPLEAWFARRLGHPCPEAGACKRPSI